LASYSKTSVETHNTPPMPVASSHRTERATGQCDEWKPIAHKSRCCRPPVAGRSRQNDVKSASTYVAPYQDATNHGSVTCVSRRTVTLGNMANGGAYSATWGVMCWVLAGLTGTGAVQITAHDLRVVLGHVQLFGRPKTTL